MKSLCNVLIELLLLYSSWFLDWLIVSANELSTLKSFVLENYNLQFESTRNFLHGIKARFVEIYTWYRS